MGHLHLLLPGLLLVAAPDALALGRNAQLLPSGVTVAPQPASDQPAWLAREGRGGARGQRGGGHSARTGMGQRASSFDRGSRRPTGGWSNRLGAGDRGRRGLNRDTAELGRVSRQRGDRRAAIDRDQVRSSFREIDRNRIQDRSRGFDRGEWDRARNRWEDQRDRQRDRWNDRRDRWDNNWDKRWDRARDRWNYNWPGWVRPGWGLARPWGWGWYGTSAIPSWGWWGARSALWGVGTLATAAIINDAVNDAIVANRTTIVVPESDWNLYYNSIQPTSDQAIRFSAYRNQDSVEMTADCRNGDLNGAPPTTSAEAQLLNAACQVAFGDGELNGGSGSAGGT